MNKNRGVKMSGMKARIVLLVLILFMVMSLFAEVIELKKISFYPKEDSDYYFRPIIDLDIIDDEIYGVVNFEHKILVFKLEDSQIKYIRDISRMGQGPGDLMRPGRLSIWNNEIAVEGEHSFSFFSQEGKYLSRFKISSGRKYFVYLNNKIYCLYSQLEDNHLMEVYAKDGKRISTFGEKYLNIDTSHHKNPPYFERSMYEGKVFSDGKHIYYFNAKFGDYFVFSLDGKILEQGNLSEQFGERGRLSKRINTELYIERSKQQEDIKPNRFGKNTLFERGYLHKNKLYFIGSSNYPENGGFRTTYTIRVLDLQSLSLLKEYLIRYDHIGLRRCDSLAVLEKNGEELIILAITNFEEGTFLEVYKGFVN